MSIKVRDKLPEGHPFKGCTIQFRRTVAEAAKQPDPKKAFRGGLVATIQENHPDADPQEIQDMLDAFGA